MKSKHLVSAAAALSTIGLAGAAVAQGRTESASGHGALAIQGERGNARQFSFHANRRADGSVRGSATLINPAFSGTNTPAPYQLHIEITCMKVVGNIAIFGGLTRRTNDPNLVDAVFFTVQDNGEPGHGDRISRVFFWDDDPATTGDPQACQNTGPTDFPLEQIRNGNIQVRNY